MLYCSSPGHWSKVLVYSDSKGAVVDAEDLNLSCETVPPIPEDGGSPIAFAVYDEREDAVLACNEGSYRLTLVPSW